MSESDVFRLLNITKCGTGTPMKYICSLLSYLPYFETRSVRHFRRHAEVEAALFKFVLSPSCSFPALSMYMRVFTEEFIKRLIANCLLKAYRNCYISR